MKYRIAAWASAGFLDAAGWALYAFATTPPPITYSDPSMTLVELLAQSCSLVTISISAFRCTGLLSRPRLGHAK
jgi:hypothetical protein